MAPLWFSSYVLMLRVPEVSLTVENIADFVAAYVIGNLLQMAFRFWAFRRFVFPDEFGRNPDKAIESMLTDGGLAEVMEDVHDPALHKKGANGKNGNVTPLRSARRARRLNQLGDSSEPRVSKTS